MALQRNKAIGKVANHIEMSQALDYSNTVSIGSMPLDSNDSDYQVTMVKATMSTLQQKQIEEAITAKLVDELNRNIPKPMLAEKSPKVYLLIMQFMNEDDVTIMQRVARMFYEELVPKVLNYH